MVAVFGIMIVPIKTFTRMVRAIEGEKGVPGLVERLQKNHDMMLAQSESIATIGFERTMTIFNKN